MILLSRAVHLGQHVRIKSSLDKSNMIQEWAPKGAHQPKYSNRKTYIDDVQRIAKKQSCPSPDKYSLTMPWPQKDTKNKLIC
jgi:hypothetical protein